MNHYYIYIYTHVCIYVHLPVRNKFVYSCSMKICDSKFDELLENIFCLLLLVEAFSLKKVVEMLEVSGSRLVTGQVNMAEKAKAYSQIYSTFEQMCKCVVGLCHGELGPFF